MQLNTLATEQDIYNLNKELEDKDITIKELATIARASDIASSKVLTLNSFQYVFFFYEGLVLDVVSTHSLDNRGFRTWKTQSEEKTW